LYRCAGHLLYCADSTVLKDYTTFIFTGLAVQEEKCMTYTPEEY